MQHYHLISKEAFSFAKREDELVILSGTEEGTTQGQSHRIRASPMIASTDLSLKLCLAICTKAICKMHCSVIKDKSSVL